MRAFEIGQQSCLIEKAIGATLRGAPARVPKPKIGLRVLMSHRLGLWEFPRVIQDFVALIGGLLSALAG